ncbi:hypothetical protein SISNIDRAFT_549579 [Sistotremastrum niveocremeum HHB9708]|uniref:DUF6699 domain-containing protein n=1 Tax=Sistotremastrum niveocremeum HHB9708 TaxID=1314777 RepID=A0A164V5L5_9AGAM|nr:hypothetical protein SISNIDRAFT_549579 [Sistotremastrum niveocremeum HHB9708]
MSDISRALGRGADKSDLEYDCQGPPPPYTAFPDAPSSSSPPPPPPRLHILPLPTTSSGRYCDAASGSFVEKDSLYSEMPYIHELFWETSLHASIDLSRPFSEVQFFAPPAAQWMADPATIPASNSLRVKCLSLPWAIEIEDTVGGAITSADLIDALITNLEREVTPQEWASSPQRARERVIQHLKRRITKPNEEIRPVRWIDYLGERTKLKRIAASQSREFELYLYTSF